MKAWIITMNILYISTVFPKTGESSTIYTDLAEELESRGHQVTVLVAEERKKASKTSICSERGCRVLRVKTGNLYDVNIIEKGISIITLEQFLKNAMTKYLTGEEFDLILYEAPPVTLSGVVEKAKRMFHAPTFLMMKDIFPQNAVDIGMIKKNSLIYFFFKLKEKQLYAVANQIGCMSEGNLKYLAENCGIPLKKLSIFPNTKKIQEIPKKDISIRDKYKIPRDKVVFIFGGNMGKPQGMKFLTSAIKKAESIKEAYFVLVGRGTEKELVNNKLLDCCNAKVMENLPRDEYEQLVSNCDVGIVSLDYRFTIPNYPSRILSYMEYGMPVLAATDRNTDFKDLIEEAKCGYWCESKSVSGFYKAVERFCDESNRIVMGINGRRYMEEHFNVEMSVNLLEKFSMRQMW